MHKTKNTTQQHCRAITQKGKVGMSIGSDLPCSMITINRHTKLSLLYESYKWLHCCFLCIIHRHVSFITLYFICYKYMKVEIVIIPLKAFLKGVSYSREKTSQWLLQFVQDIFLKQFFMHCYQISGSLSGRCLYNIIDEEYIFCILDNIFTNHK